MYVKQLLLILAALLAGHVVSTGLNLPIPASVLGLLILFLLLLTRVLKLPDVEDTADFIISHLALFFVPATVGLVSYFNLLSGQLVKIFAPLIVSILVGLLTAGWVTQLVIRLMAARRLAKSTREKGAEAK